MTGTKSETQEERNGKQGRARGIQVQSGGTVHTARVKVISREFITIYDSRSHTVGGKGLRAQSIYSIIEKRQEPRICKN
jgi:hypothetical protein